MTDPGILLIIFLLNLGKVFLRAFQQKNVIGDKFLRIIPVSYGMTASDYYSIALVAFSDNIPLMIFFGGTGAWMGAFAGMVLYRWLENRSNTPTL